MSKTLEFKPILENQKLVIPPIVIATKSLIKNGFTNLPLVAEIDPKFMGGKELSEEYGIDLSKEANCIIIETTKEGLKEFVAVIVPVGYRADLNGFVKKYLEVKKVSVANLEIVLKETQMEYGSITPFGLPSSWKILIDSILMGNKEIIIGGGKQISKLLFPTEIFKSMNNVEIIDGLSKLVQNV